MDFPALKVFVTVAKHRSFSIAAEHLYMTQPAVSKRVAALEDDLGVALFDRLGRNIQLTEAGERFLASAQRILDDLRVSREEVHSLSSDISGRLRLATSHHVGIHRLPPVLKSFTQAYAQVELDLLFMDSELACDDVARGAIELAVVTLPDQLKNVLQTGLVWPDPLGIVCAADHPLAELSEDSAVSPQTLAQFNAVLPARGTVTRDILLNALAPFDVTINTSLETNYLETIKMMVSVGLGWSALPMNMIAEDMVLVSVSELNMQRQLGYVHLKGKTLSRAAQAFIDLLPSHQSTLQNTL